MNSLLTWQTGVAAALVAVGLSVSYRDRRRLAWLWAFLLPIDYVTGVPVGFFDALRYVGAAALIAWVPADLADEPRRITRHVAAVMGALAVVRGATAILHDDPNGRTFAVVLLAATVVAYLLAQRTVIHRALVSGFVSGMALSATVALLQAMHWPTLREGNVEGRRFPGLSTYTMLLTWQLTFALIVVTYVLVTRHRQRDAIFWAAAVLAPLFAVTSLTNGAQGGLLGIGAAVLAFLWCQRRHLTPAAVGRLGMGLAALVVVVAGVVYLANVEIPSVTDVGEKDFRNERARVQVIYDGLDELRANPLVGMSRTEFIDEYSIAPHFLPVDSAAVSGVVGLALSTYLLAMLVVLVLKGPGDHRAVTVTGYVALTAMVANTLTDAYGPFVGVSRAVPLFIALVATSGHWRPPDDASPLPAGAASGADDRVRR